MYCYNCSEELTDKDNRDDELCKNCEGILFPDRGDGNPIILNFNDEFVVRGYESEVDVFLEGTYDEE